LILNKVTFHFILDTSQVLDHFNDLYAAHNGVSTGNCWDNVASHIFDLVERLLLDSEAKHS
jgi:hypothetical protein